jgi:hypothetical protein
VYAQKIVNRCGRIYKHLSPFVSRIESQKQEPSYHILVDLETSSRLPDPVPHLIHEASWLDPVSYKSNLWCMKTSFDINRILLNEYKVFVEHHERTKK